MNPWKHGCPGGGALPSQGLVRANERQHWLRWNVHRNLQLAEFASSGTAATSVAATISAHSAASRAAALAAARAMCPFRTLRAARQCLQMFWQQGKQQQHLAPPQEAKTCCHLAAMHLDIYKLEAQTCLSQVYSQVTTCQSQAR